MERQEDFSKYNGEGTTLRKAQLRMLDILIEVDKICRKHNIPYWVDCGTLLGAVRHGGFIPWDDDLDISMAMEDYKKFKKIAVKELPKQYVYQDSVNDRNYYNAFAKIRDTKSYVYDPICGDKIKYQGLYLDIFPHEKMPSRKAKDFADYIYGNVLRWAHNFYPEKSKSIIGKILFPFACVFRAFCRLFFQFGTGKLLLPAIGVPSSSGIVKYKKDIFPCGTINFEGYEFSCPHNPDSYLRCLYGDYMQLPPEEKRHPEHAEHIEFYD